jgi:hypothetical protein
MVPSPADPVASRNREGFRRRTLGIVGKNGHKQDGKINLEEWHRGSEIDLFLQHQRTA